MFSQRSTRREIFTASALGTVFLSGNGFAGAPTSPFQALARRVHALRQEAATLDLNDVAAEALHYERARGIVDDVLAEEAHALPELKVKAQLYAWCVADELEPPPGAPNSARVIASIMRDLLAA